MTRDEWESFKERNSWWWTPLTLPIVIPIVFVLWVYTTSYLRNCRIFGWKPWKLP